MGAERGAALIIVMMVLAIVSMLGAASVQIAAMAERGARNDRDQQLAWQSAEAALVDAEFDMYGDGSFPMPVSKSPRKPMFAASRDISSFVQGCGTNGSSIGLCALVVSGKPAWVTVDFTDTSSSAPTTAFGTYTARSFASGSVGAQAAKVPRYVIEPIRDPGDRDVGSPNPRYVYRVTAMGFGPRDDIQAVVQMVYRN